MSLQDPRVQKILLTVVVTVVVLWAFFVSNLLPFGYAKRSAQVEQLQAEYDEASAELEKARRTVGNLPKLEREHAELQKKWKQAEQLLPTDREVARLLTQITRAGEQAGVEFERFRPLPQRPQEFYNENPIEVQVSCGYHQLGIFLSRLANLTRLVNVSQLKLNGKETTGARGEATKASDHTLTASFMATAYSLRDPSAPATQAPPAEKGRGRALNPRTTGRARPPARAGVVAH